MGKSKRLCSLLLVLVLIVCSVQTSLPMYKVSAANNKEEQPDKPLPFRELTAEEMVKEMGSGWNLGNTMDGHTGFTPNETLWQTVETTRELVKAVHDYGFNTIRIPVTWGTMIDDENGYAIDEAWMSRVQDIADYAVEQDMYVIINIHHDGAEQTGWLRVGAEDQGPVKEKFAAVWTQIAQRFKNYDEHVIFESMNEVTGGGNTQEEIDRDYKAINELNQLFVDTVRNTGANNAKRWLAVPGRYTNIESTTSNSDGFKIPNDQVKRIFVSVHYYDWQFGLMETASNSEYTLAKAQQLNQYTFKLLEKFTKNGIPIILGEYGAVNKNNTADRALFNEAVTRICQMYGIVPVYWDNGAYDLSKEMDFCFTLIDRDTKELVYKDIVDAIMRGTFIKAKTDDLSDLQYKTEVTPITKIAFAEEKLSIKVGDTATVTATVEPSENNDVVLYKTSDPTVATVYNGMVRGKGMGTATITAYSQSGKAETSFTVTVGAKEVDSAITEITVPKEMELKVGESMYINATVTPKDSSDYVYYRALNPEVATVSSIGKVVAVSSGVAYITLTAASGYTTTVRVNVTNSEVDKSLVLSLNVYYNDDATNHFSNEVGQSITVTGDGQYTLSFDCEKDLSAEATAAGVTALENLTAVYIKDHRVTEGKDKKSPLTSCDIIYDKVVVDGKELKVTMTEPKSALKASGIFDTNDPLNSWDGSQVEGVTVDDHRLNFEGLTKPKKVEVTFTLSNMVFDESKEVVEEVKIDSIKATGETGLSFTELGATGEVAVELASSGESYVFFASSNEAVAVVKENPSSKVEANGSAKAVVEALGSGKCTITAFAQDGTSVSFEVTVDAKELENNGEVTPSPSTSNAPTQNNGSETEEKDNNTLLIFLIILAVVVVGGAVVFVFYKKRNKK